MIEIEEGAMGYKQIGGNLSFAASGSESLPLGENNAERYNDRKVNRDRDTKKQEDIEKEVYSLPAQRASRPAGGTVLWSESFT